MNEKALHLKAYAKVNLALDVTGVREDGYHLVRMIMQSVHLFDRLTMKKTGGPDIRLSTNLPYLPTNEKNLVYRAIALIRDTYGIREGVEVTIDKHIPVAAGMAGGSTDAAAALVGMNQLFGLGITQSRLIGLAKTLGADIPFCIIRGTALAEGVGELLTPLPPIPRCWFVLIKPSFSMSTHFVYEHLDLDKQTEHPDIDGMIAAIREGSLDGITSRLGNVLEQVAAAHFPQILHIKKELSELGAMAALMSGSGSTVFGVFEERSSAEKAASHFRHRRGISLAAVVSPFLKLAF